MIHSVATIFQPKLTLSKVIGILSISLFAFSLSASPLFPVKTDSPKATLKTFMEAMQDYKTGVEKNDLNKQRRILDAIRTFAPTDKITINQDDKKKSAILLKEVIDRVIVVNYDFVPGDDFANSRWRLKDTELIIKKQDSGDRAEEWLITSDSWTRAKEFYSRVDSLPYKEGSGKGAGYKKEFVERYVPEWAKNKTAGIPNWKLIGILFFAFLGWILKIIIAFFIRHAKGLFSNESAWRFKALLAVEKPLAWLAGVGVWFLGLGLLNLEGTLRTVVNGIVQVSLGIALIFMALRLVDFLGEYFTAFADKTESTLDDQLVPFAVKVSRVIAVALGVLIVLQNMGINVASLLAGLGLGGLAFALAAKDTAANLFGSIMILIDRPFKIGDWINVDGMDGTVEEIGFRSTRIRTFYNSVVSVPNATVATARVDNYGQRQFRRTNTTLGLTYDTPPEKIEAFCEGVKNILKANRNVRQDYFHVCFSGYGDSTLNIMLYFFLVVGDWSEELVERHNIYLEILRLAEELKVEFAFPTQSLHVETLPDKSISKDHSQSEQELQDKAKAFGPSGDKSKPSGLGLFHPRYKEIQEDSP